MAGRFRLIVMVLLVALALVPTSASAADVRRLAPTEYEGEYEVEGSGFVPGEEVSAHLFGPSGQEVKLDRDTASRRGRVKWKFFMPRYFEGGEWTIRLEGNDSGKKTRETFDLPQRGPNVELATSPAAGGIGTTVTITSGAFDPGERVSGWLTLPDGAQVALEETRANEVGQVAVAFAVPPDAPLGNWLAVLYGIRSDRLGSAPFQVAGQ